MTETPLPSQSDPTEPSFTELPMLWFAYLLQEFSYQMIEIQKWAPI
jgi:hypothetical protein